MAETLALGRKGQVYVDNESSFGAIPTFDATDAIRHANIKFSRSPYNRANSIEKKQSPGTVVRFDRRETASWSFESLIRPSGTLNTLAEAAKILKAGFGAEANITLSTTVSASPSPTATGATVDSATGLVVGQAITIVVSTVKYVRWLTGIATNALTWAPALPSAPATGAAVKGCVTYSLTTDLALSLAFAHYLTADTTHSRVASGCVVDALGLVFDGNNEAMLTASGPCKTFTTPAATKPAAFTTIGTQNPPSGLTGGLYVGDALYKIRKLDLQIANGLVLDADIYGTSQASGILPRGRRVVTIGVGTRLADESVIYDTAEAGTSVALALQQGFTEGNTIALYAPKVQFEVPDQDDPDDVPAWSFKGVALESADNGNDEVRLCFA